MLFTFTDHLGVTDVGRQASGGGCPPPLPPKCFLLLTSYVWLRGSCPSFLPASPLLTQPATFYKCVGE